MRPSSGPLARDQDGRHGLGVPASPYAPRDPACVLVRLESGPPLLGPAPGGDPVLRGGAPGASTPERHEGTELEGGLVWQRHSWDCMAPWRRRSVSWWTSSSMTLSTLQYAG